MGSKAKIAVRFASLFVAMFLLTTNASADLKKDGTCVWWSSFFYCNDRGRDSNSDMDMDNWLQMIRGAGNECPGTIPALETGFINDEILILVQCGSDGPRYLSRIIDSKKLKIEETTLNSVYDGRKVKSIVVHLLINVWEFVTELFR